MAVISILSAIIPRLFEARCDRIIRRAEEFERSLEF